MPYALARRTTSDEQPLVFWSDGNLSHGLLGPRLGRPIPVEALWLIAGEVELYDLSEVPALRLEAVRACRSIQNPTDRMIRIRTRMARLTQRAQQQTQETERRARWEAMTPEERDVQRELIWKHHRRTANERHRAHCRKPWCRNCSAARDGLL